MQLLLCTLFPEQNPGQGTSIGHPMQLLRRVKFHYDQLERCITDR